MEDWTYGRPPRPQAVLAVIRRAWKAAPESTGRVALIGHPAADHQQASRRHATFTVDHLLALSLARHLAIGLSGGLLTA